MNAIGTPAIPSGTRPLPASVMAALVVVTAAVTAYLTERSLQTATAITVLALVLCLYARSRTAGVIALWLLWLLTPELRRVIALTDVGGYPKNADPLALLPFLATGALGVHAIVTWDFSPRAKRIMLFAAAGFALGLPLGLLHAPQSGAFAFVAYVSGITAFALGYGERPRRLKDLTLYRVLILIVPVLAIYGIIQYFVALPGYEKLWLATVDFTTAGAPQSGHIRVFGTLNSPGTFADVLGLALICYLLTRRTLASVSCVLLVVVCLSVTYVRSAWFSVVVAILMFVLASRGTALRRVVPMVAIVVIGFSALASANSTARAVINRVDTFGNLGSDTSANARTNTFTSFVPIAVRNPAGVGLGQAGESARLGASPVLRNSDNGYLALLYQTGPLGFFLVIGAALMAFASSARMAFRRGAPRGDLLVLALLAFGFVDLLANDSLYGILGVAFWYLLGVAVASEEDRADVGQPHASPTQMTIPTQARPATSEAN